MEKKTIDSVLDPKSMPPGKTWMSISFDVADQMTKKELLGVIKRALLCGGQDEHDHFYDALGTELGSARAVDLIERAKKKK